MEPITFVDAVNFLEDKLFCRESYITIDSKTFNPTFISLILKVINGCDNFSKIVDIINELNYIDVVDLEFFDSPIEGIFMYIQKDGIVLNRNTNNIDILDWIRLEFNTLPNGLLLTNIIVRLKFGDGYFNFPIKKINEYVIDGRAYCSIENTLGEKHFYTVIYSNNSLSEDDSSIIEDGILYENNNNNIFYDIQSL